MQFDGRLLWYYTQATNVSRYFHVNALGSLGLATDQAGAPVEEKLHYPFGGEWVNTAGFGWDEKFARFPQHDTDLALYETAFREYSPGLGRWMTPDKLAGDVMNPQSLNRYAYVLNNPVSNIDPLGLFWQSADDGASVDLTSLGNVGVLTPQASEHGVPGGSSDDGSASQPSDPKKDPCHGGQKGISPAQGQQILNASQQFFNIPYDQQDCSLFVCNSINASNVLPFKINRVTAQPGPISISLSKDFKAVPASERQAADVMVFSKRNPYHMGFYVPKPPVPLAPSSLATFLSATVHGNGGIGGPRYLPPSPPYFNPTTVTYYRLQEPCHE